MAWKNPPRNPPQKLNTKIHQKFQGRGVPDIFLRFKNARVEKMPFSIRIQLNAGTAWDTH